jgi:hypothetical protein
VENFIPRSNEYITNCNNFGGPASENERKSIMTKLSQSKFFGLALAGAALVIGAMSASTKDSHNKWGAPFHADGGTTFILAPASTPGGPRSHAIDGVVRFSSLGDCTFHATANLVETATPGYYLISEGLFLFTTADGTSTMTAAAEGTGTLNPANPYMLDIQYDVTFVSGTGSLAKARGSAELHGFAYFTDCDLVQPGGDSICEGIVPAGANTGKACWLLDGFLDY